MKICCIGGIETCIIALDFYYAIANDTGYRTGIQKPACKTAENYCKIIVTYKK